MELIRFSGWFALAVSTFSISELSSMAEDNGTNQDKSSYTLFHPTPKSLMRELNTDRPDKTESPYTVDAGHYQIESDIFTYTHDRTTAGGADTTVNSWSYGTLNLKAGLCNRSDFQIVLNPYNRVRTADGVASAVTKQSGFGDVTLRLKVNAWGDDDGKTAFGIMPFVKIPSNQDGLGNDAVEGGLIFPIAVSLPWGWDLGAMTEFDWNRDADDRSYHTEFVNSITFDHDIIGKLGGYVEFFSDVSTERHFAWVGTFDVGLEYRFTENIQLDGGVNLGVTDSADDIDPFLGISIRF